RPPFGVSKTVRTALRAFHHPYGMVIHSYGWPNPGVVRLRSRIQSESRGADVEMSMALRNEAAPALRDRHDHRRGLCARGGKGEIKVLQRPLEREVGGVVASLHLGQLR